MTCTDVVGMQWNDNVPGHCRHTLGLLSAANLQHENRGRATLHTNVCCLKQERWTSVREQHGELQDTHICSWTQVPVAVPLTLVHREVNSSIHLYNFTFLIVKLHQHWLNCILSTEELHNT